LKNHFIKNVRHFGNEQFAVYSNSYKIYCKCSLLSSSSINVKIVNNGTNTMEILGGS